MISISENAASEFHKMKLKYKKPDTVMLRVNYDDGCWIRSAFYITLDELKRENDIVVESNGIKIIYESRLTNMLESIKIEYTDSFFSKRFYLKVLRD